MKNILSRLRPGAARSAPPGFTAPIMPDRPFVAVGDIHGRADLLADLGRRLEAECPDWPVVFLGDYVDRGDQSRDVLDMLMSVSETGSSPVHCLMGNHERMLLDALDDPERAAPRWLRNGGLQVLAGFGIAPPRGPGADPGALRTMRDALENAMGGTDRLAARAPAELAQRQCLGAACRRRSASAAGLAGRRGPALGTSGVPPQPASRRAVGRARSHHRRAPAHRRGAHRRRYRRLCHRPAECRADRVRRSPLSTDGLRQVKGVYPPGFIG